MDEQKKEEQQKRVVSLYLDDDVTNHLDEMATIQRRNRSLQVAFLVDEAYRRMYPDSGEAQVKRVVLVRDRNGMTVVDPEFAAGVEPS